MVENSLKFCHVCFLPKNLSNEGNFHSRIFYPNSISNQIVARKQAMADAKDTSKLCECSAVSNLKVKNNGPPENTTVDSVLTENDCTNTSTSSGCKFTLDTEEPDELPTEKQASPELTTARCDGSHSDQQLAEVLADALKLKESYSSESKNYTENELDEYREPVRRSRSLKTEKTPPGTPHRKKAVRFADALGLDLESVKHIMNLDNPPSVPESAKKDLKLEPAKERPAVCRCLRMCFPQPCSAADFITRVRNDKVSLENCVVDEHSLTITGTVRVANISYSKKVIIRYTFNNWFTHFDIPSSYVLNSNDGPTDKFSFSFSLPQYFSVGSKVLFAIAYHAESGCFWDNNFGKNYMVECFMGGSSTGSCDSLTFSHFS